MNEKNFELARELRHELHEHPELSNNEIWTKDHLMKFLNKHTKLEIVDKGAWFYAVYKAGDDKGNIAFRADIDAIPFQEKDKLSYASKVPGVAHKCGHDGHAAGLCALALEIDQKGADKNVFLLFQHAEETGDGAFQCKEFITSNNIEEIYAIHSMSDLEYNSVNVIDGTSQCASKGMIIHMEGIPTHASQPEYGKNPANALANVVTSIPELISKDNRKGMVLCTVVQIAVGERAFGMSASKGELLLTIRALYEEEMNELQKKLEELALFEGEKQGLKVSFSYEDYFPETKNHKDSNDKIRKVCHEKGIVVNELKEAHRPSEDFGHYTKLTKGAICYIGNGYGYPHIHTQAFDYRDELIKTTVELFKGLIELKEVLHTSLDTTNPIQFFGEYIIYNGQKIELGPKALYVDGSMPDNIAKAYAYAFNNLDNDVTGKNFNGVEGADFGSKAIVPFLNSEKEKTLGTEKAPIVVYLAPYVYWGDNWADPAIRRPTDKDGLYGITLECRWLKLVGLTDNREKIIICGDRGQTHGSNGNWTLFNITGDGLRTEHITIANYCNIDLEYPLKSALNHKKRTTTICQAQLVKYTGDKAFAIDTSFRSRHNLMPFAGTRTLFYNCHFECYHDSLMGYGVYLDCDFDFYEESPVYKLFSSVFLNCKFTSYITGDKQGVSNIPDTGAIIDSNFIRDVKFGKIDVLWSIYADLELPTLRAYQSNVTLNGQPIVISEHSKAMTVDIANHPDLLAAYKFVYKGKTYYNTYNLLRGNDDWDPMGIKEIVAAASFETGKDIDNIPVSLTVSLQKGSAASIFDGETTTLTASFENYFGECKDVITWAVLNAEDAAYVMLPEVKNGTSIKIKGNNKEDLSRTVTITASTKSGLASAYQIIIKPVLELPPAFIAEPEILGPCNGKLTVTYMLDLGTRSDSSLISWYRCTDGEGANTILTAVTRMDEPEKDYILTDGDVGHFIKAVVEPKHIKSNQGIFKSAVSSSPITSADVKKHYIETNFQNFPVNIQTEPLPGFWMVNAYNPPDTYDAEAYPIRYFRKYEPASDKVFEYAAINRDDAKGFGLVGTAQGGRILYTPTGKKHGDMKVTLNCDVEKTTGEGFGSANSCYVDLFIKYDTKTLNGYSVRVERTPAQWNGCEISLMKHINGYSYYLPLDIYGSIQTKGETAVKTSAYMSPCTLTVWTQGNKLYAAIKSGKAANQSQIDIGLVHEVYLRAAIDHSNHGGAGYINTGTVSAGNRTILHNLRIEWDSNEAVR